MEDVTEREAHSAQHSQIPERAPAQSAATQTAMASRQAEGTVEGQTIPQRDFYEEVTSLESLSFVVDDNYGSLKEAVEELFEENKEIQRKLYIALLK